MKLFILGTLLSLSAFASQGTLVEVPLPENQSYYYGNIQKVEGAVLAKLKKKAIEVCGTAENVGLISNVQATFHFSTIENESTSFVGSYPMASAKAMVHCID